MIDPHVHLRDWGQSDKETMSHGFSVAWRVGIGALFEMPNTTPPLTNAQTLRRRRDEADHTLAGLRLPLRHHMYAGLTADPGQIREVVGAHREMYPRVIGLKLYAGHSTGRLGVTETVAQFSVWRTLVDADYRGVVAVHAEREDLLRPNGWNPDPPDTHGEARPPLAELASVQTQLTLAEIAGFRGHLHICHVSLSDTVTMVRSQRAGLPYSVSLGATPHHLLLDESACENGERAEWNVNPPLRSDHDRRALCAALVRGDIDFIESDHAPHTLADKQAGASGLPGFPGYRLLVDALMDDHFSAVGLNAARVHDLTVTNACAVFGLDPESLPENANCPLGSAGPDRERRQAYNHVQVSSEYQYDPYRALAAGPDFTLLPSSDMLTRTHAE